VSTGGTGGVPPDPALCGNGQLDAREACDDGNRAAQNGSTDFCSADCGTSTWPCGSWPDPVRSEVELEACRFYVSNVSVNGSATGYAVVKAGSVFATTSTLTYQDCGYCPGCYVQGYAGLIAGASPAQNDGVRAGCDTYQGCEENLQRGDNALEVTYTAPAQPGTYYYRVGFSLDYSCTAWTTCPPAAANSFAVCVVP
jgi:cysteine-rich repeat protein